MRLLSDSRPGSAGVALFALLAAAASTRATIVNVSTQGVILTDVSGICEYFASDDGKTYFLNSTGGFTSGDRVYVTGSYDDTSSGFCFNFGGPRVTVTAVKPAFAGVGTLAIATDRVRLLTDDGRSFTLPNSGGFRTGARVYVEGIVQTGARTGPAIVNNVIGNAFSDFGRLTDTTPGSLRFKSDAGVVYSLDRTGSVGGVLPGEYVFVEGIRGKIDGNGVIPLTSVTARPAFHASGRVVAAGSGVAFQPDTLILDNRFTASALAGFPVGSKVYLRGRNADDYDYGEAKPAFNVRLSRASASYTGVGFIDTNAKVMINLTDGNIVHLENIGDPIFNPNGSFVYVAGAISAQSPGSVTLVNNETRIGVDAEGFLVDGFGCTPIIQFDGGGYLFPKYNAPYHVGDHVRVIGGITFEVPCTDENGLVDNSIVATPPPCIDCE